MTAKTKKIDLALLNTRKACNEPFKYELKHPITKEPLGVYVWVLGKDAEVIEEYTNENINKLLRQRAIANKRGEDAEIPTV